MSQNFHNSFGAYSTNLPGYTGNSMNNATSSYNNPFLQSVSALASYAAAVGYGSNSNNNMLSALSERYSQNMNQADSNLSSAAALLKSQKYYEAWQQCYNNSNIGSSSNLVQGSPLNRTMQDTKVKVTPTPTKKEKKPFLDQKHAKKEFDQLSKARTDKLISDGPSQLPMKAESPVKQQPLPVNPQIKLIQLVMDEKKRSLFKSPAVIAVLQKRQKAIEIYKKRTELFSITMMAQHQAVLNIQRQQQLASPHIDHSFSHKRSSQI